MLVSAALAVGAVSVLGGHALAQSSSDIAGVWAFNGGQVGVVKNADKSFTGTVIRATRTTACPHPIGERMWTDVRLGGGDINWWGKHVWFLTQPCRTAPSPGYTAWKIFVNQEGKEFLRGCYAHWAHPEIQPVIDRSGQADPGSGGICIDSYRVTQKKTTFKSIARFPESRCFGAALRLKFADPPTDALATVRITAGDFKSTLKRPLRVVRVAVAEGTLKVKVKVIARTVLGQTIRGSAIFKRC